ncbi:recombinase family protein [Austwickia chelonae]|uniref:recombinase family protein n=1 Tax=Austwickia chelonae TaxID=100225 RepID=UPI0013C32AE7|nr:recombinase family protein [Austwickia chelonae]
MDRLGRSERVLVETLHELGQRGIDVRSLREPVIDTTAMSGQVVLEFVAILARARRELTGERTVQGLAQARRGGRKLGRPSALSQDQVAQARLRRAGGESIAKIAEDFGVGASTVSRTLRVTSTT